jgi:hypothetical protein
MIRVKRRIIFALLLTLIAGTVLGRRLRAATDRIPISTCPKSCNPHCKRLPIQELPC